MKNKNDLSLLEFLDALQREYFLCDVRSKFYYNPNDKRYYKKVATFKKEKILKIQGENKIPTIFNNGVLNSKIKEETLKSNGLPLYDVTEKDIENYYSSGSDIKCWTQKTEFILGKIISHDKNHNTILVRANDSGKEVEFSCLNSQRLIQ